jgi:CRISPR-associated protein (TIGR02710 family)
LVGFAGQIEWDLPVILNWISRSFSVGLSNIAGAISLSIKRENPEYVLFLTSPQSKQETIPCIEKTVLENRSVGIESFEETDDVEIIYLNYVMTIRELFADGYKKEDIVIDYTSGTKAMSAALFAAGIALEVGSINYIAGKRDSTGRVIPGTERPISINPLIIFAENIIKEAQKLFNRYQFQAAQALLEPIKKTIKEPAITVRVDFLLMLTKAYALWDTFKLKEAADLFGKIKAAGLINNHPVKDAFQKNFILLSQEAANRYSIHRLVDLLQNIYRRMEEGKYDDAQARIYRLFEYMAQIKLYNWNSRKIETAKFKLNILPENIRDKYSKQADENGEIENISMVKAFALLEDLSDELGRDFMQRYKKDDSVARHLLNKRNKSILAHGFTAIDQKDCEQLIEIAREFLVNYFPEWINEQDKAVFPRLE